MPYTAQNSFSKPACPRLHCCPGISARGRKADSKTLAPKWLEQRSVSSSTERELSTSESSSPCNQLPPGTCLFPAHPPPYLALALVRTLHPSVQLPQCVGAGEKDFSLISCRGCSKCCYQHRGGRSAMGPEEEEEEQASSLSAAPKTPSLLLGLRFQRGQTGTQTLHRR